VRLLLDTHIVLWQLGGERDLAESATTAILSAQSLHVSVVSFAEIGVKVSVGKLDVPDGILDHILGAGLKVLALSPEHGLAVARLPMHHRDPFDRLLVTQAQAEDLTIVTADERIMRYDVRCVSAVA
jgi:PIN domain nuclease of toxin-antitoxin system